jgi:chemotaxis protein methyltransferase CheR
MAIASLLGLALAEMQENPLEELLLKRSTAHAISVADYLEMLDGASCDAAEIAQLARELTVTETYFLRNPAQFKALAATALPDLLARRSGHLPLRLLSLGCASGEEAYSLAIAAHDLLLAPSVSITGADINPAMLEKARAARYTAWSLRELEPTILARWFSERGGTWQLRETIRRAVDFKHCNLVQSKHPFWHEQRYDVIFCRNVLMYLTPDQLRATITRITHLLQPEGYLFLGHAESLRGISTDFQLCHSNDAFYYQRKQELGSGRYEDKPSAVFFPTRSATEPTPDHTSASLDTDWVKAIQHTFDRIGVLAKSSASTKQVAAPPDLSVVLEHVCQQRYDYALQLLEDLPTAQGQAADAMLLKAICCSQSGAVDAAEQACRNILVRDDMHAGAHYVLALCRESEGDTSGAMEQNRLAAHLDPSFAMPHFHLGLLAKRSRLPILADQELALAQTLLEQEDTVRIQLYGGGFKRDALIAMCRSQRPGAGRSI